MSAFAQRLEVALPEPGGGVSSQLSHIVDSLKKAARPTLLIFDSFEQAGNTERWVQENLLPSLLRISWLRVIIAGQCVPSKYGEPWEEISFGLELHPPTPQEWLIFGKRHKPTVTLDFVRQAHELAGGKGTVLAQLLGPKV